MTPQKAIYEFKEACAEAQKVCECKWNGVECPECHYYIAIKALEKQIPKKPTHLHHCPNCGTGISIPPVVRDEYKPFAVYPRFCRDCGQAIDWSDTE